MLRLLSQKVQAEAKAEDAARWLRPESRPADGWPPQRLAVALSMGEALLAIHLTTEHRNGFTQLAPGIDDLRIAVEGLKMQVSFNFCQPNNSFMKVGSVNRGLNSDNRTTGAAGGKNQDRVDISPQGKVMSAVENLMKQKESIKEQRKELLTKTLESGGDYDAIKEQLKTYDEQMSSIDEQISQLMADQAKKAVEKGEDKKSKKADESKTEEQLETEKLTNLANVTEDIKSAKTVASVQRKMEGEVRVDKSEIKIGEIQVDRFESKTTNVKDMVAHAKSALAVKRVKASELQSEAMKLDSVQAEKLGSAMDALEEGSGAVSGGEKAEGAAGAAAGDTASGDSAKAATVVAAGAGETADSAAAEEAVEKEAAPAKAAE